MARPCALLTTTFNEVIDPEQELKRVHPQTVNYSKAHVVTQGETLSGTPGFSTTIRGCGVPSRSPTG
jgi:hypothetical protein